MSWDLTDVDTLKRMALAGANADEISVETKKARHQVEAMAELLCIPLACDGVTEWCDRCCSPRPSLDPDTGWCPTCTALVKLEADRLRDEEEEARLERELIRKQNNQKKERERMRQRFGANPRKGKKSH